MKIKILTLTTLILFNFPVFSLPIDWGGELTFDTINLSNGRFISKNNFTSAGAGSQEVSNTNHGDNEAAFQSYIFNLSPTIIVNDSVVLKGEISNGFARGGRLGDSSATNSGATTNPGRYYLNLPTGQGSLTLNHLYSKIYGTTATYTIGRHPVHWGLGAVINSGEKRLDRFASNREGISAKIKLGRFEIEPFISRSFSSTSLGAEGNQREMGSSVMYHSIESELKLGLYYSSITTGSNESQRAGDLNSTGNATAFGAGKVKLTDFFLEKTYEKFNLKFEVPIFSGTIGDVFQNGQDSDFDTKAILFEGTYHHNDQWKLVTKVGLIDGEDGNNGSFEALYLHPNYQVANILFRYNRQAIWNTGSNVFDSSINNANYLSLQLIHYDELSTWKLGVTYAKASNVASAQDQTAYNHTTGVVFNPSFNQSDDLGVEVDLDYKYELNDEVTIDLNLGYLSAGDYFAYTNSSELNSADSAFLFRIGSTVQF